MNDAYVLAAAYERAGSDSFIVRMSGDEQNARMMFFVSFNDVLLLMLGNVQAESG